MDLVMWLAWSALMLVASAVALLPQGRRSADRAAERLARRSGLELVPAVRARVARRLALQRRWSTVGGVPLLAAATVLLGAAAGWRWSSALSWSLVGAAFAAGTVGAAVAALEREPLPPGAPRLARSTPVTVADHLPAPERIAARALAALGLVAAAVAAAAHPDRAAVPVAIAVVVVASVVLFEVGSRRIVDAPQAASSADELAWDDAFRSLGVRTLALAPVAAGGYAGLAAGWALAPDGTAAAFVDLVGAVVVGVFFLRSEHTAVTRHFLRRLWPEAARALEPRPEPAS